MTHFAACCSIFSKGICNKSNHRPLPTRNPLKYNRLIRCILDCHTSCCYPFMGCVAWHNSREKTSLN